MREACLRRTCLLRKRAEALHTQIAAYLIADSKRLDTLAHGRDSPATSQPMTGTSAREKKGERGHLLRFDSVRVLAGC
jgi:hypothetical protein